MELMNCVYFIWCLLLFDATIEAAHFRGGTITWKLVNNNVTLGSKVSIVITQTYTWTKSIVACNSTMITNQSPAIYLGIYPGNGQNLMCIANCTTAGGYVGNEVPITGYCTDTSTALDLTVSQRSDIVNLTAASYFTVSFASIYGNWQTLALGNTTGWSISCSIDLRVRSDNGLINTPPVATCVSYISIPVNVQQTIQIPVLDADNDFLRCRFANGSSECYNTCPPGSLPPGTTLSSSCVLTITGPTAGKYYLIALQVEDFMTMSSSTPLSSVPLQFLVYVYANQSCALKPLLIDSVNDDACQGVQVGVDFTMTLTAINRCGGGRTMSDIATLSFPIIIKSALVQNTTNSSLWSMQVTWRPTATEVGSQVFCAVASDNASVQSDQYCITLYVGLSSVPLCPGATAAPTTMIPTTQSSNTLIVDNTFGTSPVASIESSIAAVTDAVTYAFETSQQDSTVTTTTLVISSSTTVLASSTAESKGAINWPLIAGLSSLALLMALCCSLCCCYHLLGPAANRRRQKKIKDKEDKLEFRRRNGNHHQTLLRRRDSEQNYAPQRDSSTIMVDDSPRSSSVHITRINQRKKSVIDNQGNETREQSYKKTTDPSQSKSRVSVQRIDRLDKPPQVLPPAMTPNENLARPSVVSTHFPDLSTVPSAASTRARANRVSIIQLPRWSKAFLEPHQAKSAIKIKAQPRQSESKQLKDTRERTTSHQHASSVSVSRVRRSLSTEKISHADRRTKRISINDNMPQTTKQS